MPEPLQQLRDLIIQGHWEAAAGLLRQCKPEEAGDAMLLLPFEQQRLLFRHLPVDLAAIIAGHSPYFHACVLLYSLTAPEIAGIVGAMGPTEREQFLDALPEESWQSLMNTMEEVRLGTPTPVLGGSKDSDGRELDALGITAQKKGAKAVVATLWQVDDTSVGLLMPNFYKLWITMPGMTKVEALQREQLAILHGTTGSAGAPQNSSADASNTKSANSQYRNPYYWAPFILIGNWK